MINWNGIRVAYRPYDKDCTVPGDRRRFAFYAKERNIHFEIADTSKKYDVVYLTYGCDLGRWINYKKTNPGTKIIFELIDSYLMEDAGIFTFFRGIIRYITKRESRLFLNYKRALRKMVSVSDAVVCSTPIQKEDLSRYNNNIHISLDYFSDDITKHKISYTNNGKLKLVWEGQAYTVKNLLVINDVLDKLKAEVELHIITDPVIKFPLKIFNKKTDRLLKELKCDYYLYNWTRKTFSEILSGADLAIIPISKTNMMRNKPENKLLLFWEMGIPVLTSDTPAYKRVMDKVGIDYFCSGEDEWLNKIRRFIDNSPDERKSIATKANIYLQNFHNKEIILKKWDAIFESL
jgi:glycosyltransferase involved in cell wall biosynthesis